MDIDFIKWKVELADGFTFDDRQTDVSQTANHIVWSNGTRYESVAYNLLKDFMHYPLLLQRAARKIISENKQALDIPNIQILIMDVLMDDDKCEEFLRFTYNQEKK